MLVFIVLVLVIWNLQRRWRYRREHALASKLQSYLTTWPVVGHVYKAMESGEDRMKIIGNIGKHAIENGGISKVYLFDRPIICVADPEITQILMNECLEKHIAMQLIFRLVLKQSSLIAPVPIWRPRRKAMQLTFSTKTLSQFVPVFTEHANRTADLMNREVDRGTFSCWDYMSTYTLSSVCESAMGVRINEGEKLVKALNGLWEYGLYAAPRPWYYFRSLHKFLPLTNVFQDHKNSIRKIVREIIDEKRKMIEMKANNTMTEEQEKYMGRPSYLGRQLEAENKVSEDELLQECMTLVLAGFDTTAITSSIILLVLSRYPEVQNKLYQELRDVVGDSDRPIVYEDLTQLKYMEVVIKETLRLYPVAPVIARKIDKDVTLPSGLTIVKDCGVVFHIWGMHRNPKHWGPDAEQFRPERFLEGFPTHPTAFMAFSYGVRNCVGYRYAMLSLKTVLATLLWRYKLLPAPELQISPRISYNFVVKDLDGYQIQLERRNIPTA